MDERRFDYLTRSLARVTWRRRGVASALAGSVLVLLGGGVAPGADAKKGKGKRKPKKCKNGAIKCGKACVNPQTDAKHCGGCNQGCGNGETCVDGECQGGDCLGGQILCNALCVDPTDNDEHCGRCNNPCPGDLTCIGGECACAEGTKCGNQCVDTQTDDDHCGGCNSPCTDGHHCQLGECRCPGISGTCPIWAGLVCCAAYETCANLSLSNSHCGVCGNQCATGTSCCGGRCVDTITDTECCGETNNKCEDGEICCFFCRDPDTLLTDGDNCGTCRNSCRDILPDGGHVQCCGGGCVDVLEDRNNCGDCDIVCETGYECQPRCCGYPPASCVQVAGGDDE